MAEYIAQTQDISLGVPIVFDSSIPCNKGYSFHADGTGVFILKGVTNNCFARYQVTFTGNISIPESGELSPIGIAISENGEIRSSSLGVFTPQAVEEQGQITSKATITVPKGCCFAVAVRYADATVEDPTVEPTPTIEVRNGSLEIVRTA